MDWTQNQSDQKCSFSTVTLARLSVFPTITHYSISMILPIFFYLTTIHPRKLIYLPLYKYYTFQDK